MYVSWIERGGEALNRESPEGLIVTKGVEHGGPSATNFLCLGTVLCVGLKKHSWAWNANQERISLTVLCVLTFCVNFFLKFTIIYFAFSYSLFRIVYSEICGFMLCSYVVCFAANSRRADRHPFFTWTAAVAHPHQVTSHCRRPRWSYARHYARHDQWWRKTRGAADNTEPSQRCAQVWCSVDSFSRWTMPSC